MGIISFRDPTELLVHGQRCQRSSNEAKISTTLELGLKSRVNFSLKAHHKEIQTTAVSLGLSHNFLEMPLH